MALLLFARLEARQIIIGDDGDVHQGLQDDRGIACRHHRAGDRAETGRIPVQIPVNQASEPPLSSSQIVTFKARLMDSDMVTLNQTQGKPPHTKKLHRIRTFEGKAA